MRGAVSLDFREKRQERERIFHNKRGFSSPTLSFQKG